MTKRQQSKRQRELEETDRILKTEPMPAPKRLEGKGNPDPINRPMPAGMIETLPAEEPPAELTPGELVVKKPAGLVAMGDEWRAIRDQAKTLVRARFYVDSCGTPEKAMTIMLTGRELGLGPMASIRGIHAIEGKPSIGAELMMGLARKAFPDLRVFIDSSETQCVIKVGRNKEDTPVTIIWNLAMADKAGLSGRKNWQRYPGAMLRARAISAVLRIVCPDVTMGLYTPDEMVGLPTGETPETFAAEDVVVPEDIPISDAQRVRLFTLAGDRAKDFVAVNGDNIVRAICYDWEPRIESTKDIRRPQYDAIIEVIKTWEPPRAQNAIEPTDTGA